MSSVTARDGVIDEVAPAKVNLFLHVTGRRNDGYHELDSLVYFADAGDRVVARPAQSLNLDIGGPFAGELSAGEDNLVIRAAQALAQASGCSDGASLRLEKQLPVASGVGGGSADAAATLRVLNRLWRLNVPELDLARIAGELGADVPMCVYSRTLMARGIGEKLSFPADLPAFPAVLVNPGVDVPTPVVFRARVGAFSAPATALPKAPGRRALADFLMETRNDLEEPARALFPAIGAALQLLGAQAGVLLARMSGSGATCFGLFDTEDERDRATAALRAARPQWWVCPTMLRGASD